MQTIRSGRNMNCQPFCSDGFTNDGGGFDRVDDLFQGLQVRVIVSKLLFFVVEVTSSLKMSSNDEKALRNKHRSGCVT